MFYIIVIAAANILISLINALCILPVDFKNFANFLLFSALNTVAVIAVDGITALFIRRLPEKWFSHNLKIFGVPEGERKLYKKLKVKAWKHLVPELGGFTNFHKDKLESRNDKIYLERFLLESDYGVVIHIVNAVFGFLIILIPVIGSVKISLPVAAVNFVLSLLPIIILRYNTPVLIRLLKHSCCTENKER